MSIAKNIVNGITREHHIKTHKQLAKKYGKASKCENQECVYVNPKRYEYALRKGHLYSDNILDYIQLCPSCHRKYDENEVSRKNKSLAYKFHYAGNNKIVVDTQTGVYYNSVSEAANFNGLKRRTLIAMLVGQNPNKTNLRYA